MNPGPAVRKVVETGIYVKNLQVAEEFYKDVLGLELVGREKGRHVFLRAGRSMLLLFNAEATLREKRFPPHGASGSQHFALEIEGTEYDQWKKALADHRVRIEKEVNWGASRSLYFRDPDGNLVELITTGSWPLSD